PRERPAGGTDRREHVGPATVVGAVSTYVLFGRDPRPACRVRPSRSRAARSLPRCERRRSPDTRRCGTRLSRRTGLRVRPTTAGRAVARTSEPPRDSGEAVCRRLPALHLSATTPETAGREHPPRSTRTFLDPLHLDHSAPAPRSLRRRDASAEARRPAN